MAIVKQVREKYIHYDIEEVHVDNIRWGDCVIWGGKLVTVGKNDIKYGGFVGTSLFGDSMRLGTIPVQRANILRARL